MSLLSLDTLDDRREIWGMLARLSPSLRVAFLARWCARVPRERGTPKPSLFRMGATVKAARTCGTADRRLTNELYHDFLQLACNFGVDLGLVAADLEQVTRGRAEKWPPSV